MARSKPQAEPEGSFALLTRGDIDDMRGLLRGAAITMARMEALQREQLEVNRAIARNTACLRELLDALVDKRTNGHIDLQASMEDAEGTKS